MPTKRELTERIAILETHVAPPTSLSEQETQEITARLRAEGSSEQEIADHLHDLDPRLLTRGLVQLAAYDCHSLGFGPPGTWACRHSNSLVRLIGWLKHEHAFEVAIPDGRQRIELRPDLDWQSLAPIALHFLSALSSFEDPWRIYWSRPREIRKRYGLDGFYIGTSLRRAQRFERENDPDVIASLTETTREVIEFALSDMPEDATEKREPAA